MEAVGALPTARGSGFAGRRCSRVPGLYDLYLAGDWVGREGFLVDASVASVRGGGRLLLENGSPTRRSMVADPVLWSGAR